MIMCAPFGMFGHRHDHLSGCAGARKRAQYLSLVQEWIYENYWQNFSMAFRQQCSGNATRSSTRKYEFVSGGKLRSTLGEEFLRDLANFRGRGLVHANSHNVRHEQLAQKRERVKSRRVRMLNKTKPDGLTSDPPRPPGDTFKDHRRRVNPMHQNADVRFLQVRIRQE